ncbi:helix-turn-helix transcriptional regulator [Streptomyces sp. NPDC005576]|uniref:helix-turn-helix transcriptional regulator n=1 Tax=Streptomyces sp. NPDC005576 TaxID=3364726 RepID=UPI0036875AD6
MDTEKPPPTWPDAEAAFISEMKRQRARQNLSQGDLAERVKSLGGNMFQQTIAKLETGQRALRMSEADVIAGALGMTVSTMLAAAYAPAAQPAEAEARRQFVRVEQRYEQVRVGIHSARERAAQAEHQLVQAQAEAMSLDREAEVLRAELQALAKVLGISEDDG